MQSLDEMIGTNTYFHETEKYEDRLDSQTVKFLSILINFRLWKFSY